MCWCVCYGSVLFSLLHLFLTPALFKLQMHLACFLPLSCHHSQEKHFALLSFIVRPFYPLSIRSSAPPLSLLQNCFYCSALYMLSVSVHDSVLHPGRCTDVNKCFCIPLPLHFAFTPHSPLQYSCCHLFSSLSPLVDPSPVLPSIPSSSFSKRRKSLPLLLKHCVGSCLTHTKERKERIK